jgi:hypothetical protein
MVSFFSSCAEAGVANRPAVTSRAAMNPANFNTRISLSNS